MRRAANFLIPMTLITLYYAFWVVLVLWLLDKWPEIREVIPLGDLSDLPGSGGNELEPIYSDARDTVLGSRGPVQLAVACVVAGLMIIPVSWVYFITSRNKEVDQSFAQTIIIMPIVVTGIAMIVANSIALAFSLAGIVAAVRFRFTLSQPSHAMYIFVAISIGLAAGIGALGISAVISMAFVYTTMIIWKLEYGKAMSGPFFSMLTRRDNTTDDDY
jgi:hypothetical protein